MAALPGVNRNIPLVDEIERIDTTRIPTVILVRLGFGKPQLDWVARLIAQNDFKLNCFTNDLQKRARIVATKFILKSRTVEEDEYLAYGLRGWLCNKVSFITEISEETLKRCCEAYNRCSKTLGQPEMDLEAYGKFCCFGKNESKEDCKEDSPKS